MQIKIGSKFRPSQSSVAANSPTWLLRLELIKVIMGRLGGSFG